MHQTVCIYTVVPQQKWSNTVPMRKLERDKILLTFIFKMKH